MEINYEIQILTDEIDFNDNKGNEKQLEKAKNY